jgi:hypothetical protein
MNHFFQKRKYFIFGAGGGKPKAPQPNPVTQYPSVLAPPTLGCFTSLSSFSYADVVDLLSDGPIEGLVNKFGQKLYDDDIKEGIYYNDTVIKEPSSENSIEVPIDFIVTKLKELWYPNGTPRFFRDSSDVLSSDFSAYSINNDENFLSNLLVSIKSYHPNLSINAYAEAIGAKNKSLNLIKKIFNSSPIKGENLFFTKITIPEFKAYLPVSKFDFTEGGASADFPIRLKIPNISDHIYFSIGIDDLTSFNYFEIPRSYLFNNILTSNNKSTVVKTLESENKFGLRGVKFINVNIFIWSIYNEDLGIKDISKVLEKYLKNLTIYQNTFSLYNYPLTDIETKNGHEFQTPLESFSDVRIEVNYNKELSGPYKATNNFFPCTSLDIGGVQRLCAYNGSVGEVNVSLENETSDDIRFIKGWPVEYDQCGEPFWISGLRPNYALFDSTSRSRAFSEAVPITHYITNQNVESVNLTLNVQSLYDVTHVDLVDPCLANLKSNKPTNTTPMPINSPKYSALENEDSSVAGANNVKDLYFLVTQKDSSLTSYILDGGDSEVEALTNLSLLVNPNSDLYGCAKNLSFFYEDALTTQQEWNSTPRKIKFKITDQNYLYCYIIPNGNSYLLCTSIPYGHKYAQDGLAFNCLLRQKSFDGSSCYNFGLVNSESIVCAEKTNIVKTCVVNSELLNTINSNSNSNWKLQLLKASYSTLNVNSFEFKHVISVEISNLINPISIWDGFNESNLYALVPRYSITRKSGASYNWITNLNILDKNFVSVVETAIEGLSTGLTQISAIEYKQYFPKILLVGINLEYLKSLSNIWEDPSTKQYIKVQDLNNLISQYGLLTSSLGLFSSWNENSTITSEKNINWYSENSYLDALKAKIISYNPYSLREYNILNYTLTSTCDIFKSNYCCFLGLVYYEGFNALTSNSNVLNINPNFCGTTFNDIAKDYILTYNTYPTSFVANTLPNQTSTAVYKDARIKDIKQTIAAGTRMPTVVSFQVEMGYESDGTEGSNFNCCFCSKRYDIYGLIDESTLLDFGAERNYKNVCIYNQPAPRGVLSNTDYNQILCNNQLFLFKVTKKINGVVDGPIFYLNKERDVFSSTPFDIGKLCFTFSSGNFPHQAFSGKSVPITGSCVCLYSVISSCGGCRLGLKSNYIYNKYTDCYLPANSENLNQIAFDLEQCFSNIYRSRNVSIYDKIPNGIAYLDSNVVSDVFNTDSQCDFSTLDLLRFYSSDAKSPIFCFFQGDYQGVCPYAYSKSLDQLNCKNVDTYEINADGCNSFSESENALKIEISNFVFDLYSRTNLLKSEETSSFSFSNAVWNPDINTTKCIVGNEVYVIFYCTNIDNYTNSLSQNDSSIIDFPNALTISKNGLICKIQNNSVLSCDLVTMLSSVYPNDTIVRYDSLVIRITQNSNQNEDSELGKNIIAKFTDFKNYVFFADSSDVYQTRVNDFSSAINTRISNDIWQKTLSSNLKVKTTSNNDAYIDLASAIKNQNLNGVRYRFAVPNNSTFVSALFTTKKLKASIFESSLSPEIIAKFDPMQATIKTWVIQNLQSKTYDIIFGHYSCYENAKNDIFSLYSSTSMNCLNLDCYYCGFSKVKLCLTAPINNLFSQNKIYTKGNLSSGISSLFPFPSLVNCVDLTTNRLKINANYVFKGNSTPKNYEYNHGPIQCIALGQSVSYSSLNSRTSTSNQVVSFDGLNFCKISIPSSLFDAASNLKIASCIQACFKKLNVIPSNAYILNGEVEQPKATLCSSEGAFNIYFFDYKVSNQASKFLESSSYGDLLTLPPPREQNGKTVRRYVKVKKLSHETLSPMIVKRIALDKVTEIIPQNFSYPFSAIVSNKIDARAFNQIPERTYEAKLKKVLVPSNYYPIDSLGKDVRYLEGNKTYKIYDGDWDGTFKLMWTNNPAWIILDLLINKRYGLGAHIESQQVDIWELYKIARWCDGVDDDGFYEGVSNGSGGVEPRHTFNAILTDNFNIFELINQIASVFRGNVFYMNNLITFDCDRKKPVVGEFNNLDVKDGIFNYANLKKDDEFTALEVGFIDEKDFYKQKIEYIEDTEAIRSRGLLKKELNVFGITSRSQARRFGRHVLYETAKENLNVQFITDVKALLYKPGDIISIQDELMSSVRNYGSVKNIIDINDDIFQIVIDKHVCNSIFSTQEITLYTSLAKPKYEDILSKSLPLPRQISIDSNCILDKSLYPSQINGDSISVSNQPTKINFFRSSEKDENNNYTFDASYRVEFVGSEQNSVYSQAINLQLSYIANLNLCSQYDIFGHWVLKNKDESTLGCIEFDNFCDPLIKKQYPHKQYFFEHFCCANIVKPTTGTICTITGYNINGNALYGFVNNFTETSINNQINLFNFEIVKYDDASISYIDTLESDKPSIETFYTISTGQYEAITTGYYDSEYSLLTLSKRNLNGFTKRSIAPQNGGLDNIKVGSPYSLKIINCNPILYKIVEIKENYINEYSVSAKQYHENKFAEIDENPTVDDINSTFDFMYAIEQASRSSCESSILKAPVLNDVSIIKYPSQEGKENLGLSINWTPAVSSDAVCNNILSYKLTIFYPSNKISQSNLPYCCCSTIFNLCNSNSSLPIEVGTYKIQLQAFQAYDSLNLENISKISSVTTKNITVIDY